jgi:hypothetical protein
VSCGPGPGGDPGDAGASDASYGADGGDDAGTTADAGGSDAGKHDSGTPDAGRADSGSADSGGGQGSDGGRDAGTTDAGGGADGGTHVGPFRILFDSAHEQVAGNADWIVDTHAPDPSPANPTKDTDWNGGISSWGYGLYASGRYSIRQLPPGTSLSHGGGGAGDLAGYDVFISVEPEKSFSASEVAALNTFAQGGGGIFLVSDHSGASRCGSCTEAWKVVNAYLEQGASGSYGVKCDGNDIGSSGLAGTVATSAAAAPFHSGPFGTGSTLMYHSGSSVSLTGTSSSAFMVVTSSSGGMMAAASLAGGGRLVVLGDSSPPDDGTCSCNASLYGGWQEADDAKLILNATAWLAHDGS